MISVGPLKTLKPVIQLFSIRILLECKTGKWEDQLLLFQSDLYLCCMP